MKPYLIKSLVMLCCLVYGASIKAQTVGKVLEQENIHSALMHKDVHYTVYLPPDYDYSQRSYPVVYLLHGFTDDNTGWLQFGEINTYMDKGIADGVLPPMIIIMPNGDSSFYINAYDGKESYEDFFIKEFMPAIEKKYRIKADRKYRGIAGLSMGGYGALIYSLKHPDLFAAAAPLSAWVATDDIIKSMPDGAWQVVFGPLFGRDLKGADRMTDAWRAYSPLALVDAKPTAELSKVRYWIDCGDKDGLSEGNCLLHIALMHKNIPHEFRIREGNHNWTYWRTGITDALKFISESFTQK
jgi:S-formylglutathione hydrolase FrmB